MNKRRAVFDKDDHPETGAKYEAKGKTEVPGLRDTTVFYL